MNNITKSLIFSTVFLIPFYLIRFSVFGIPTNVLEILIYLTFVFYLLEKPKINFKGLYQEYRPYVFSIALISLGLIISTLINPNYRTGFGIIKGWFFDPLLFSFVLIQKIKLEEDIEKILKSLYFSSALIGSISLVYFFLGKLTFDSRLSAFYSSPNYLAMSLAPAVFIGIYFLKIKNYDFIRNSKFEIRNYLTILFLFVILSSIYLTYSYAAWLSIILSLLIISFITKKLNKKLVAISALVIFFAILSQINNSKFKDIFSNRSSLESRIMIWKSSALMIKNNFILGIGPGNFQNKYLEYQKYFPPYLEWAVPQPHSLYMAFWLQSGITGFFGFISLIFIWVKKTMDKFLTNKKNSITPAVYLGIILCILIHGFFDTTYWKNDLSLVFWIIFILENKS